MKYILRKLLLILVSCVAYVGLFFIPKIPTAKLFGVISLEHAVLLTALSLFLFTATTLKLIPKVIAFILTCAAFTLPLIRIWQNAETNWYMVLGLLPWSDASGYFIDANSLLDGRLLGEFSGRRPLFPGFLATLLALTGRNLQITLIIMTLVASIAAYLASRQIQRKLNPLAGALSLFLVWLYYRQTTGTTLTEQLGLPMGVIAFGILLASLDVKKGILYAVGLFFLSFALLARAGAFFILPTLVLWGLFYFPTSKRQWVQHSILFSLAILAAATATFGIGRIAATQNALPMGNFSYTLYGQVTGGKGWTQVYQDYPEISSLPPQEQMQMVYQLAWQQFIQHPQGFLMASVQSWIDYIVPSNYSVFSFLNAHPMKNSHLIQLLATSLLVIGIVVSIFNVKEPLYGVSLSGFVGIILSLPLIPPTEAAWMRIQAATIIWPIWLLVLPFSAIWRPSTTQILRLSYRPAITFGGILVLVATLGPVILQLFRQEHQYSANICPEQKTEIHFFVYPGAHVTVQESQPARFPVIDNSLFERSMSAFPKIYYEEFTQNLMNAQPPFTLVHTRELSSRSGIWIIGPPTLSDMDGKKARSCATFIQPAGSIAVIEQFEPINE